MRLRFAIALLAIAVLAGGCAATRAEKQALGAAYSDLLMEGDTTRARERLEPVRDIYDKLFLMACAELNDGNLDAAKSYAERMVEMKPKVPDGKVLLGLVERRIDHPEETWVVSFATAWKEEGSPELTVGDDVLDCNDILDCDACNEYSLKYQHAYNSAKGTPDELLMADTLGIINADTPAKTIELSLKYSEPDAPLEIRVLALSKLWNLIRYKSEFFEPPKVPENLRPMADKRISELLRQLAKELPSVMIYDMLILLEETSDREVFDDADVSRLEEIVKKKKIYPERQYLFRLYKDRFEKRNFPLSHLSALNAVFRAKPILAPIQLKYKIYGTSENASQKDKIRLADIYEKIGIALTNNETYIEFNSGYISINSAKEMRGEEVEMSKKMSEDYWTFKTGILKAFPGIFASEYWPIRQLHVEAIEYSIEDDVRFYLLFTDTPMPEELKKYLE